MAFEQPYQVGDWLSGRQFDADGHAIAFDPTQLDTINGVQQKANYGPYVQQLLANGTISEDRVLSGSALAGSQGQRWFPGTDGNIYLVDGSGQRPVTRIPMSNIDPRTGKDKVGSVSDFLDPKTGAVTGTGKADFAKIDPGEMIALATIAAISGGAALTGMGVIGAGAGAAGGAGGTAGAAGLSGWDAAMGDLAASGGLTPEAMGAAGGIGGGAGAAVFNPAVDSQLASTQLGITGSQALADASAGGIPGVTLSNVSANGVGGLLGGQMTNVAGSGLGSLGSAISNGLSSVTGSGTGSFNWGSLLAPALNAVGGAINANAAGKAADAMVNATNAGIAENGRQFDVVRGLLQPYVTAGTGALSAYQGLSGLNGAPAQQTEINALTGTPQYTSLVNQGEDAILQNAAATGGLRGGNVQGGLANFRSNLLSSLIDKQLSRYGTVASMGQSSAAGVGNAAMQTGAANSNLLQQQGAAQAGGIVAGTNAITNAIGGIGGFLAGQNASTPATGAAINPAAATAMNPVQFGTGVVPSYGLTARSF